MYFEKALRSWSARAPHVQMSGCFEAQTGESADAGSIVESSVRLYLNGSLFFDKPG